jgi:hypothetical protein
LSVVLVSSLETDYSEMLQQDFQADQNYVYTAGKR